MVIISDQAVYETIGEEGFAKLVAAFYARVKTDDIIGPMYPPDDWEGSEERLRDFLIYRFGGSQRYIEQRGHPRLRMRHMPFAITPAARDRWLELMNEAIVEAKLPETVIPTLQRFFVQVANFMVNRAE